MFQVQMVLKCHEKITVLVRTMVQSKPAAVQKAEVLGN